MKLAINLTGTPLESGTRTYCVNFLRVLNKTKIKQDCSNITIFITSNYLNDLRFRQSKKINIVKVSNIYSTGFFKFIFDQFFLPLYLIFNPVDKLFCPINYCPILLKFSKIEIILGIHSNLPWLHFNMMPGNLFKNIFIRLLMTASIIVSNKIIFCSNTSKKEMKKFFKNEYNKFYYVYLGANHLKLKKSLKKTKNYILIVSSIVRYHNILNLLKSYKKLQYKNDIPKLILITQILDNKYFKNISDYKNSSKFLKKNFIIKKNIENKNIYKFYEKSLFSVNSSIIESFGFAPIESMALGCPTMLSKQKTYMEIYKNSALFFNGNSINQIKNKFLNFINNKKIRQNFKKKGLLIVKKYKWERTLDQTLKIIKK